MTENKDFLKLNLERKMGYNNNIKINIQILEIIKYKWLNLVINII